MYLPVFCPVHKIRVSAKPQGSKTARQQGSKAAARQRVLRVIGEERHESGSNEAQGATELKHRGMSEHVGASQGASACHGSKQRFFLGFSHLPHSCRPRLTPTAPPPA